jgi:lysophospholipase L1-like esterase
MLPASQPTLVLGDSLGLVAYPYLADLLPDRYVSYAAEVGRSTANTAKALKKLASVPPVVIVSSGTNDGTVAELTTSATAILDALGSQRCVVWVDVVRPDRVGDTQEAMNAALDTVVAGRSNVSVLRWSAMVAQHPEWLAGDGIHPTEDGAKARAQAYADASAACSPIDPSAPKADRQYLPDSVFWGPISGSGQKSSGGSSTRSASAGSSGSSPSKSASPSTSAPSPTKSSATPSATKTSTPPPSSPPATSPPATTTPPAPQANP